MRIFITGASGCIGHYITDLLIKNTEHELFLLVRNPSKLKFDYQETAATITTLVLLGNVLEHQDLLKTINVVILIATCWGGEQESYQINVEANLNIINSLNFDICQQIIYFSTASILDYPTLVFGGDETKPYSHLSGGLKDLPKWMNIIRWFQADGSFHFIHGYDIAQVIDYLIENGQSLDSHYDNKLVLANEPLTVNQAIKEICNYLNKKVYFQIPLPIWLANIFIKIFNIQMAKWDYFCLNYRHFTYSTFVNPQTLNLEAYAPDINKLMEVSQLPRK